MYKCRLFPCGMSYILYKRVISQHYSGSQGLYTEVSYMTALILLYVRYCDQRRITFSHLTQESIMESKLSL